MTILGVDPVLKDPDLKDNADIIAKCVKLGYVKGNVLDPTFGEGNWWTHPDVVDDCFLGDGLFVFTAHDLYKLPDAVDFRYLPHVSNTFDCVTFDPPYCAKGGRKTSGIKEMDGRYGQDTAPATPEALQSLINDGLRECARVLKPRGYLLVKCMNYISGGKFWPGLFKTWEHAVNICGLTQVDQFVHANDGGPQPGGRRQLHARNNASYLLVFTK